MLARDHAIERARKRHDARDGRVRLLQHLVVVAVDGNVGVHIAVAGMHVQRDPDASAQDFFVNRPEAINDGFERFAREDVFQRRLDLSAPRHTNFMRLQSAEICIDVIEQTLPMRANVSDQRARFCYFFREKLCGNAVFFVAILWHRTGKERFKRCAELELVAD